MLGPGPGPAHRECSARLKPRTHQRVPVFPPEGISRHENRRLSEQQMAPWKVLERLQEDGLIGSVKRGTGIQRRKDGAAAVRSGS